MRDLVRVTASAALLLSLAASPALLAHPRAAHGPPEGTDPQSSTATPAAAPATLPELSSKPMQEHSRLEILRGVDGEFARATSSLPATTKGFHIKAGQPLDQTALHKAIVSTGAAFNPGDGVQITRLQFLPRGLQIDINGGGRVHRSLKDHLQLSMGVGVPVMTSSTVSRDDLAGAEKKTGATVFLDFNRPLPDMSAAQVKQLLAQVLDFTKQRSAAVAYVSTLPPKFQEAIADNRPEIGMDRDEVTAALGRPDHKVRDRDPSGNETEDWIYGRPPEPTTFVQFTGDTVTQIHQYPHPQPGDLPETVEDTAAHLLAQR